MVKTMTTACILIYLELAFRDSDHFNDYDDDQTMIWCDDNARSNLIGYRKSPDWGFWPLANSDTHSVCINSPQHQQMKKSPQNLQQFCNRIIPSPSPHPQRPNPSFAHRCHHPILLILTPGHQEISLGTKAVTIFEVMPPTNRDFSERYQFSGRPW